MFEERIYLDHNATMPVRPEAARAVGQALLRGGNPSSVHAEGRRARAALEEARAVIAGLVGGSAKNTTFTSGATEALNLALTPTLQHGGDTRPWRLLVSATEHPCVLRGHRFPGDAVTILPVTGEGVLALDALDAALAADTGRRPLLALQFANNETGVIQPLREAADRVHAAAGLLVCDAVQAAGRVPLDMRETGADMIALSAHKLGGPTGIGALVRAHDTILLPDVLVRGGGQEKGLRAGTENGPGIAGFAAAAQAASAALADETARVLALRARMENGLRALDASVTVFGSGAERLPNTVCFAVPGLNAQTALMSLDLAGVSVSSGSACSSGTVKASSVLDAMGVPPDMAKCMLRASLGWTSREADVDGFLAALAKTKQKIHTAGRGLAA
jgi:cysteine desulfurase